MSNRTVMILVAALAASCSHGAAGPTKTDTGGTVDDGQACQSNDECKSGYCISIYQHRQCAALCPDGACDGTLVCKHAAAGDMTSPGVCVAPSTRLCGVCSEDGDCAPAGDLCLADSSGATYCGSDCTFTTTCPAGYDCQAVTVAGQAAGSQCLPSGGICGCDAGHIGTTRACQNGNEYGTCDGNQTCQSAGWSDCDARTPAPEVCDGIDNDCDGYVDADANHATLKIACSLGVAPARPECQGFKYCQGASGFGECTLANGYTADTLPTVEYLCDGLDDNCNGQVDDGLLGTAVACANCTDVCAPLEAASVHAVATCDTSTTPPHCGAPLCQFPYFDVDGDITAPSGSDGCEVRDNTVNIAGTEYLNNTPARAIAIGTIVADTGGSVHYCYGQLPTDDPANHVPPISPMADDYYSVTFGGNAEQIDLYIYVDLDTEDSAIVYYCASTNSASLSCGTYAVLSNVSDSTRLFRKVAWFDPGPGETWYLRFYVDPAFPGFAAPYHFELVEHYPTTLDTTTSLKVSNCF